MEEIHFETTIAQDGILEVPGLKAGEEVIVFIRWIEKNPSSGNDEGKAAPPSNSHPTTETPSTECSSPNTPPKST